MTTRMAIAAAICILTSMPGFTTAAPLVADPAATWFGKVPDESLRKLAPATGFIADEQSLSRLWKGWRPGEELPTVDFTENLILVGTVSGPNLVILNPNLDDKGDVTFVVGGTKIGGPGFGYKLITVSRKGIKSVNGNALPDSAPAGDESVTVKIVGTLQTGVIAIGGETTGTTISAKGITWELDFGQVAKLGELVKDLNGKRVVVEGTLERRGGVEVKDRWIVSVSEIRLAE